MQQYAQLPELNFVDLEEERRVLAALARSREDFFTYAGDQLDESVFASAEHAELYRKIAEAHTEGGTPPSLEDVEPPEDLPTSIQRLAELRRCRTAVALVSNFLSDLASGKTAADALSGLEAAASQAAKAVTRSEPSVALFSMGDLLDEAIEDIKAQREKAAQKDQASPHPSLGPDFPELDRLLGGLQPRVYVLGGRPGVGKTYLSLYLAHLYLQADPEAACLWVDAGETRPPYLLALRLACMAAQKCPWHFERGTCQPEEVEELKGVAGSQGLLQRFAVLEASPRTTTADIHIAARKLMLRQGASRLMIVVDFLQRLGMFARTPGEEDAADLRSRVNSMLHRLSALCTVTGGPLLLISALGKEGYRPGRAQEPSLANYRETSEIEYSCDVAMQLEWADDARNSDKGSAVKVLDLYVLKNRSGDTGRVRIYSLRDKACFTENDPGHRSMNLALLGLADAFSREEVIEL